MAEDATLTSWPLLEELSGHFEDRHPGVRVRLLSLGGAAGSQDKVKFLLAGDLPLDVTRIDITELAAFAAEGALVDLAPFAAADPDFRREEWFAAPLAALAGARGELYGLPQTFTPYVMYVNRSLLAELELSVPPDWTWDDLVTLCRAASLDADGDGRPERYGISLTQWLQAVAPWLWQNGARLLDEDGARARMGEPEFVESLAFLRRLLHEERLASFDATFANQLKQGLFQAGRCLFYGPVGYWETYRFQHVDAFEWDVLPLPRGRERATAVAMGAYVVPRTARAPELAWAFVREVLGSRAYQERMAEIGNGVPGLRAAAESPAFLRPDRAPASARVFLDEMQYARFLPPLANWRKIESLCQAELEGVLLTGDVSPRDAARRMAAKTDAYLARERARRGRPALPGRVLEACFALSIVAALAAFLALRRRRRKPRDEGRSLALIGPWAVGFLLFLCGPAVVSLLLSWCEWSPLAGTDAVAWAGLAHYRRLATDATFHASLGATTLYAVLAVPLSLLTALALALLLAAETRWAALVRTVVYLPAILSPVIVAAVWQVLLDADQGTFNRALELVGLEGVPWLVDPGWVVPSLAGMAVWSVGTQMLVFLAALKAQDRGLLEAARVDGAGAFARLVHVTLPGLTPVILFNLVTGVIAAFQVFAQPYIMTRGGPGDASRFLVLYLYESGFRHLDMGYASAIAWVLFAILAALSAVLLATSRRWVHYAGRAHA